MNQKTFSLSFDQADPPFDANMLLFGADGGDRLRFELQLRVLSFGGASAFQSGDIGVSLVSDSDVSGSPVSDGSDIDEVLFSFHTPEWPRSAMPIGPSGPVDIGVPLSENSAGDIVSPVFATEFGVPARGRSFYLRLTAPDPMPDSSLNYSFRLEVTATLVD